MPRLFLKMKVSSHLTSVKFRGTPLNLNLINNEESSFSYSLKVFSSSDFLNCFLGRNPNVT